VDLRKEISVVDLHGCGLSGVNLTNRLSLVWKHPDFAKFDNLYK